MHANVILVFVLHKIIPILQKFTLNANRTPIPIGSVCHKVLFDFFGRKHHESFENLKNTFVSTGMA